MTIWWPFDRCDSERLEIEAATSGLLNPPSLTSASAVGDSCCPPVPVRGGRYDVMLHERQCKAVFWEEEKSNVRRTSWLFRLAVTLLLILHFFIY